MNAVKIFLTLTLLTFAAPPAPAGPRQIRDKAVRQVTLLSNRKYGNPVKAVMNFGQGVTEEFAISSKGNAHTLRYDGTSPDGARDWLEIRHSNDSQSQIKDLGELNWSDVYDVPFLHASVAPHPGPLEVSVDKGKAVRIRPENVVVKATAGHIYLIHFKGHGADFYVMFRVETLKSGDECTISWKPVPSPEP